MPVGCKWPYGIYRCIGGSLFLTQTRTHESEGKNYIKTRKRTHERQENERAKEGGKYEIRRESPGGHKSNEAIG